MLISPPSLLLALVAAGSVHAAVHLPLTRRATPPSLDDIHRAARKLRNKYAHLAKNSTATAQRRASANVPITDLGSDTTYYASVNIGSPGQPFNVILDTGSSDLWVLSPNCLSQACRGAATFDTTTSSSFTPVNRPLQITYGSGRVSGTQGSDTVQVGSLSVQQQQFGLITQVDADLIGGDIGGLMGLAFESIAKTRSPPIWQSLQTAGQLDQPLMAFSLDRHLNDNENPFADPNSQVNSGGTFTLGGVDTSLFTGSIDFVNVGTQQFWSLPIKTITVNGQSVPGTSGTFGAIDTGTTLIGGPSDIVAQIYSAIGGAQGTGQLEGLWTFDCNTDVTLALNFGGQTWNVSPQDFLVQQVGQSTCIGGIIDLDLGGDPTQGDPSWIIGDTFLKNVYSVFRFSDPPAVGFAAKGTGGDASSSSGTASGAGSTLSIPGSSAGSGVGTALPPFGLPSASATADSGSGSGSDSGSNGTGTGAAAVNVPSVVVLLFSALVALYSVALR